jgi:hypothetical protein
MVITHTAKHTKSEEDPQNFLVTFSSEMQEQLQNILIAVRSTPKFDDLVFAQVQELAAGKKNVVVAMGLMKDITENIERHANAEAHTMWREFVFNMGAMPDGKLPFTLTQAEKQRGRG